MDLQLTTKANEALAAAARAAAAQGHPQIEPAQLLKALAEQPETTTPARPWLGRWPPRTGYCPHCRR
jgi:hypothetical protein